MTSKRDINVDVTSLCCINVDKTVFLRVVCLLGYRLHSRKAAIENVNISMNLDQNS